MPLFSEPSVQRQADVLAILVVSWIGEMISLDRSVFSAHGGPDTNAYCGPKRSMRSRGVAPINAVGRRHLIERACQIRRWIPKLAPKPLTSNDNAADGEWPAQ